MHLLRVLVASSVIAAAACSSKAPDQRTFPLKGQIQSLEPAHKTLTVKHEEIKNFMPAMTMPYDVQEAKALDGLAAGDLIDATLIVHSNGAYLKDIKKTGQAPLEKAPPDAPMPTAAAGFELLKPGEQVPDTAFVDQNAKKRPFSSFKGSPVVLTFIYTKCPMPTFCPLMDRHFAAMQKPLKDSPELAKVRLVTVSFDPETDTPPVLKAHAKTLNADLTRWSFLTGERDEVDKFAARFGVSIARSTNNALDITHNLRTAIIDADGKIVKVYTGNDWSPDQILAELKKLGSAS